MSVVRHIDMFERMALNALSETVQQSLCRRRLKAEVRSRQVSFITIGKKAGFLRSFITTTIRDQRPRSHR